MRRAWTGEPESARALRRRLVWSILVAALLPFGAAFWIANGYFASQQQRSVDDRLAFALRSATAEYGDVMARTREKAAEVAARPAVVRALSRKQPRALERALGPREAAVLASGRRVGSRLSGVPVARAAVVVGRRRLGTVEVAAPAPASLLAQIARGAPVLPGDILAVSRGGLIVAGPARLRGALVTVAEKLAGGHHIHGSVRLPGYADGTRLVALVDGSDASAALSRLRRWLALVGGASLASILLYAAALARPLVQGFDRVADVAQQAEIDPLTGVANRRGFERALAAEMERSSRYGRPCSVVLADLDDFKRVNDHHGHDAGDAVLVAFAARLRESIRASDLVARLGGEEFALVLPEIDLDGGTVVAERIRRALGGEVVRTRTGKTLSVTASFGVAEATGSSDWEALVRRADEALYAAKGAGKNRVVASPAPRRRGPTRLHLPPTPS